MAYLGHGAVAVVGHAVHHHRHAAGAVTFVTYFFDVFALVAARPAFDGAVYGVLGHVVGQGVVHGRPQARVAVGIAAAHFRRHGDFPYQFGE